MLIIGFIACLCYAWLLRRVLLLRFEARPMPRCQACSRAVGAGNGIRGRVGSIIIACRTCSGERRR
jgi:hypothetical protein